MLGAGVLIQTMFGDNSSTAKAITLSLGKTLAAVEIDENVTYDGALVLTFDDGSALHIYDDGGTCCERRYLHTDDDLDYHVGAQLMNVEVRDGPVNDEGWETHEIQFLLVTTTKGVFTVETHNIHNGYYAGFYIKARLEDAEEAA